jgi:excisionase family DNA binding protein
VAKEKVQEPQTWFNVQEASDYLRISRPSLYELIKKGVLPSYTIKGLKGRRFRREDLDALMIPDETYDFDDED